jgi:hypothetical protein
MYTLEQSKTIIENAGGCSALATKLNKIQSGFITRQRIEHWNKKGIPAIWQLTYGRFFNRLLKK